MERITQKDLEKLVARINTLTGSPQKTYEYDRAGRYVPQAGNYHLSYAHGGVKLERMSLTPNCSGISEVSTGGYETKRALYTWMQAFIAGIEAGRRSILKLLKERGK